MLFHRFIFNLMFCAFLRFFFLHFDAFVQIIDVLYCWLCHICVGFKCIRLQNVDARSKLKNCGLSHYMKHNLYVFSFIYSPNIWCCLMMHFALRCLLPTVCVFFSILFWIFWLWNIPIFLSIQHFIHDIYATFDFIPQ